MSLNRSLGTVTVAAPWAGKTLAVTRTLTIPARVRIGSGFLLACLGAGTRPRCAAVPLPVLATPTHATGQSS